MNTISAGETGDLVAPARIVSAGPAAGLTGGNGADTLIGSVDADTLDGGRGDDLIHGGAGADLIFGGNGDDTIIWSPGGGSDTVDGGLGYDTLVFNMSEANEIISVLDFGGHAFVTGGVKLDLVGVERLAFAAHGGGSDIFFIAGLGGTDVRVIDIDLGGADGLVDIVHLIGGPQADHVVISGAGGDVTVGGLSVAVSVAHAEAADRLLVRSFGGADTFDVTGFLGGITLVLDGGFGADRFEFASGNIEVVGFQAHSAGAGADLIVLHGFADATFDEALANQHIVQSGADVIIADGSGLVVTLRNLQLAELQASDFLFS